HYRHRTHARCRMDSTVIMKFKDKLSHGYALHGTFVKIIAPLTIEVLVFVGFDFVVLVSEHAPFDRQTLDIAMIACRAAGLHGVVRVRENSPREIMNALDLGAEAVIVPHVRSAADARRAVDYAIHCGGSRGYTNSSRAGDY